MSALLPATTTAAGQYFTLLDTCKVPPTMAPVPFPNVGLPMMAVNTTTTVLIQKRLVLVMGSIIPMSTGDEPGLGGGVVSAMIKGPVSPKIGSSKVIANGKKVTFVTAQSGHNGPNPNTVGLNVVPSQAMVMVSL